MMKMIQILHLPDLGQRHEELASALDELVMIVRGHAHHAHHALAMCAIESAVAFVRRSSPAGIPSERLHDSAIPRRTHGATLTA